MFIIVTDKLELHPDARSVCLRNHELGLHFVRFNGRRYVPNAEKNLHFPEDDEYARSLVGEDWWLKMFSSDIPWFRSKWFILSLNFLLIVKYSYTVQVYRIQMKERYELNQFTMQCIWIIVWTPSLFLFWHCAYLHFSWGLWSALLCPV